MELDTEVCVIGGGPAGMMAAARAAECGARVLLLEKNRELGRKLLITGGGRCNVTNAEFRNEVLVEKYGYRGRFLHSLFSRFGPSELIELLASYGLGVVVEEENRAFPETHRAASVLEVLRRYLTDGGVKIRTATAVRGLLTDRAITEALPAASGLETASADPDNRSEGGRILGVALEGGTVRAREFILATGGLSRPDTGSTGDGLRWLAAVGHAVHIPEPSLVPVRTAESWVRRLQGLSFDNVRLTALPLCGAQEPSDGAAQHAHQRRRRLSERGKLLFTHFGLSGPLVLNMSAAILSLSRECEEEQVRLLLDLVPTADHGTLDRTIRDSLAAAPNRKVRNSLPGVLPSRIVPVLLELARVDPDLPAHSLTRIARREIVQLVKALPLTFDGVLGADKAIVTSGGIELAEVDFRTMRSRLYENLYLAGDILDFQRRSGGYSLQICWSSGWVAGTSAAGRPRRLEGQTGRKWRRPRDPAVRTPPDDGHAARSS